MNYEYPLNRNRLRIEQEELLLKLALFHYLERENDRLRARMQEQPDPPEDRESAEHAVDRAMRRQRWQVIGQKAWQVSGRVVTRVAVVFLAAALSFTTAFAISPEVRETVYRLIMNTTDRYTEVSLDSNPSNQFIDPELYTWEHCYAPTWLPNGYEVKTYSADVWGVSVVYQNGSYNLSFDQFLSDTNLTLQTDSENALETKMIFINDSEALINTKKYSEDTYTTIIWRSGNALFRVITNDTAEVAVQFAKSIKALR